MNDDITAALKALAVIGGLAVFIGIGLLAMKSAKRGGKGMHALGVALSILGSGAVRDPRNDTVAEAQDGRIRRGNNSGDPLSPPSN